MYQASLAAGLESPNECAPPGPYYTLGPDSFTEITPQRGIALALSKEARKCVVFLGSQEGFEGSARIKPIGTGFLFQGPLDIGAGWCLVPARHIAEKLDAPWLVRMNKKGGAYLKWGLSPFQDLPPSPAEKLF